MRYLNFILTVIAICLVYQCVTNMATPAKAGSFAEQVNVRIINSSSEPIPIELKEVDSQCDPIKIEGDTSSGSVPVTVKDR